MRILAPLLFCAWIAVLPASGQEALDGPLPECEDSQRCAYEERAYPHEAEHLFATVRRAINRMTPVDLNVDEESLRLTAAFRVFFFLDDVNIALRPLDGGTQLYIRSASRTTFWDGGTNKRRINGFFERLDELLEEGRSG